MHSATTGQVHGPGAGAAREVRLLFGYTGVSVIALAVDVALLGVWVWFMSGSHPDSGPAASVASYLMGALVHYKLCTRLVFGDGGHDRRPGGFTGFLLAGLVGLAVTWFAVWSTTTALGWGVLSAKALAVPSAFLVTYAIRRWIVFGVSESEIGD